MIFCCLHTKCNDHVPFVPSLTASAAHTYVHVPLSSALIPLHKQDNFHMVLNVKNVFLNLVHMVTFILQIKINFSLRINFFLDLKLSITKFTKLTIVN